MTKYWPLVLLIFNLTTAFAQKPVASNFEVKTYSASGTASVNSHYLVTDAGVIMIDAQRVLSQAKKLLEQIKATGKPVIAVILTHNHPDHIGGLAQIVKEHPNVAIYATQTTAAGIAADKNNFQKLSKEQLKEDFPDQIPAPNKIIRSGESFAIGEVNFEPRDLGAGEAESILALFIPAQNILFASDLIANRMTPFLLEGQTGAWIKQLDDAAKNYSRAKIVYPGHGASGNPKQLFGNQREYLTLFRKLVAKAVKDGALSIDEKRRIVADTERRYQGYLPVAEIPDLLDKNVDAVAKEVLGEKKSLAN